MRKMIYIYVLCGGIFLFGGCSSGAVTCFSPDRIFLSNKDGMFFVANRGAKELLLYSSDLSTVEKKITFDQPVADMLQEGGRRLWVIDDGADGKLYEVNASDFSILSETKLGSSPSAMLYNPQTKSLWITQRFNNALWEVDTGSKQILTRLEVGREPVDMVMFDQAKSLLVINNMPEMSSRSFPVAALLTVVDVKSKDITKRILLPNGSTDVKGAALSSDQKYAYITHLLARYQLPTNQVDRGWMTTNALSIVDLDKQELLTTVLLDTPQKGAANPWEVTVTADDKQLLIVASGAHELVSIDRQAMHERIERVRRGEAVVPSTSKWEDIPNDAGFLYGIISFTGTGGKGPRSIVTAEDKAFTANYFTGELVQIDLQSGEKKIKRQPGEALISTVEGRGYMYFHDSSLCFQGWQSCISCHPNDGRMDGLNWDQKNDGLGNPKNTKSLLLSHATPPSMVTGIRKDAETAVRAGYKHILFAADNEEITNAMDAWLKSLKPRTSPYLVNGRLSEAAERGKEIFTIHCATCHSGPYYTDMKQYDVPWATGSAKGIKMDVPTLIEAWRTAPYLYDGRAYSMREMLDNHRPAKGVSDTELDDLAEYVLSL